MIDSIKQALSGLMAWAGITGRQATFLTVVIGFGFAGWALLYNQVGANNEDLTAHLDRIANLEGKALIYDAIAPAIQRIDLVDDELSGIKQDLTRIQTTLEFVLPDLEFDLTDPP